MRVLAIFAASFFLGVSATLTCTDLTMHLTTDFTTHSFRDVCDRFTVRRSGYEAISSEIGKQYITLRNESVVFTKTSSQDFLAWGDRITITLDGSAIPGTNPKTPRVLLGACGNKTASIQFEKEHHFGFYNVVSRRFRWPASIFDRQLVTVHVEKSRVYIYYNQALIQVIDGGMFDHPGICRIGSAVPEKRPSDLNVYGLIVTKKIHHNEVASHIHAILNERRTRETRSKLKTQRPTPRPSVQVGVRLSRGTYGRVELYYNNRWGTVCGKSWNKNNCRVICNEMGLPSDQSSAITPTPGKGMIWLDNVRCSGAEQSVSGCLHDLWGVHSCDHSHDAGCDCRPKVIDRSPPIQSHKDSMNPFSASNFKSFFSNAYGYYTRRPTYWYERVTPRPTYYRYTPRPTYYRYTPRPTYYRYTPRPTYWYERVTPRPTYYRYTPRPTIYRYTPRPTYWYQTRRPTYWYERVTPRPTYYRYTPRPTYWYERVTPRPTYYYYTRRPTSRPTYYWQRTTRRPTLYYYTPRPTYYWQTSRPTSRVSVPFANGDVRLTNGNFGRVEVFYSNQWGTVCDDRWDSNDCEVVCRQLGFYSSGARTYTASRGSGNIWLDDVQCQGRETRLDQCSHKGWGINDCDHTEDAGCHCSALRSGAGYNHGRLLGSNNIGGSSTLAGNAPPGKETMGAGPIIGIMIASCFFLAICAIVGRRMKSTEQNRVNNNQAFAPRLEPVVPVSTVSSAQTQGTTNFGSWWNPSASNLFGSELQMSEIIVPDTNPTPVVTRGWMKELSVSKGLNAIDFGEVPVFNTNPTVSDCGICFAADGMMGLSRVCPPDTNHFYCGDCLNRFIETTLDEGSFPAKCPGCKAEHPNDDMYGAIEDGTLVWLSDQGILEPLNCMRFINQQRRAQLEALADGETNIVRCPQCHIKHMAEQDFGHIRCGCGTMFCLRCENEWILGHTCRVRARTDYDELKATRDFIVKSAKPCPSCGVAISHYKGHACHHIRPQTGCPNCHKHFCYICLKIYPDTGPFVCDGCPLFCNDTCGCPPCPDCTADRSCPDCSQNGLCPVCPDYRVSGHRR